MQEADLIARVLGAVDSELSVGLTQRLVRVPSVVGDEEAIGRLLEAEARELGLEAVRREEVYPDRSNTIGHLDFGSGPSIVLTGHMDTKPVCGGWDQDPYGGTLIDSSVYGHGIMDMKSALACQLVGMRALQTSGVPLKGRVTFVAVCDHMGEQGGARAYFSQNRADMAVLGELTDNQVAVGHRGRFYWDITTLGRSAHTCHKYDAINAIPLAAKLLLEIEKIKFFPELDERTRELFGTELYMSVGRIFGGLPPEGPSMIPDNCTMRVDSRPQPGVPSEAVRAVLDEAIHRLESEDPDFRCSMVLADEKDSHLIDVNSPVVRHIRRASEIVQGGKREVVGMSWLGDTATFGKWVPTVIYGPGREPVYMPNEHLSIADIETATKVYALTAAFALTDAESNGA